MPDVTLSGYFLRPQTQVPNAMASSLGTGNGLHLIVEVAKVAQGASDIGLAVAIAVFAP